MAIQSTKLFPLGDRVSWREMDAMGIPEHSRFATRKNIMAVWNGYKRRCPRKGEWYLSGAIVEAYRAPHDLNSPFYIAKLVRTETITKVVIVN